VGKPLPFTETLLSTLANVGATVREGARAKTAWALEINNRPGRIPIKSIPSSVTNIRPEKFFTNLTLEGK
jgi:hypothetical protein